MKNQSPESDPLWQDSTGAPVSCIEKIKVLNENHAELRQIAQDALEDGILMGCSEAQLRAAFHQLIDALVNPYQDDQKQG